ncbi:LOW QUALITY PROTEIN: coronin-7-like, partial [Saccoglossus kowalevskii]|uniref:Coronin n=1 Tax=Saccoglossus kowalevskii TaxID=10224 RepID=A0ABM0MXZ3_SACKO
MSYRFKASKYKNATPKIPKKEGWISDISVGSPQSCGNHIKASCALVAFNIEHAAGGSLGIVTVNEAGRKDRGLPLLHAHSQFVTDFDFSPFDDYLLATCSQDCTVKIWSLPEGGLTENISNPETVFPLQERKVENVLFHPAADNILASSVYKTVKIWDIVHEQEKIVLEGATNQLQGLSWKQDGSLLATTCKDKKIRIFDPRAKTVIAEASSHGNMKDSRVCWMGNKDMVMSTGFSTMRERQYYLWDIRNIGQRLSSQSLDSSTGTLMPFYDPDTNMIFLAGKGDTTIKLLELTEKSPYLTEVSVYMGDMQQKGIATVPKRALNIMTCEVNRLLQLTQNAIIPVSYVVPRKTHRDFHADLYPDTLCGDPAMTADNWLAGDNHQVSKVSLQPTSNSKVLPPKRNRAVNVDIVARKLEKTSISEEKNTTIENKPSVSRKPNLKPKPSPNQITPIENEAEQEAANNTYGAAICHESEAVNTEIETKTTAAAIETEAEMRNEEPSSLEITQNAIDPVERLENVTSIPAEEEMAEEASNKEESIPHGSAVANMFAGVTSSKFRHIQGVTQHRNTHIYNIRNLSTSTFGECDGFHANKDFAAIPIAGPGGLIAILNVDKPGKLPDTGVYVIQNGNTVMDFKWDPFDTRRMAVACDDAVIRIWMIPEGGLTETLTQPEFILKGHEEKIYFLLFHPLVSDLLLSASYDMSVRIWDLDFYEEKITLHGHQDQIFGASWSPDGVYVATVSKDKMIRIYEPRKAVLPIREGPGLEGSRGARIVYACNGQYLIVLGFDKQSSRKISVHNVDDLTAPVAMVTLDVSPATLIPYYDDDTSVLFCTGKGDRIVQAYEVISHAPYLVELSEFRCTDPHQAMSFLPKITCDVKKVEVARALRLSKTTIEPIVFTVPRVK